jgi:hypothetical protein
VAPPNPSEGTWKFPLFLLILIILVALAYIGHRAAVRHTVETVFYGNLLASPPPQLGNYPTELARLERCEKFLDSWRGLSGPVLDFERMGMYLPLPLRLTRTTAADNPEELRKKAGELFARDLAALSGRKAASATLPAWEQEIRKWRAEMGR